jgi:inorganic triphosphatase YgiF
MEIELKLGVSAETLHRIARALARRTGSSGERVHLSARYFDTPGRLLQANGIALRVRREGSRWVQAVKRGRAVAGGLHRVAESEVTVGSARLVRQRLPADIAMLIGDERPEPVAHTRVWRRRWTVAAEGGLVEVALDRGEAGAAGRTAPIAEIEFELKGGSPGALYNLAGDLLGSEAVRADLPNKAAQAFRLLEAEPPLRRLGSKPRQPAAAVSARDSFADALAGIAAGLMAALHETLTQDSPDGPHQLRVALRRLRVLFRLYRPILDPADSKRLTAEARRLGRLLSPLRDADVLVPQLAERAAKTPALGQWHADLRTETRAAMQGARATAFGLHLLRLSALGGWHRRDDRDGPATAGGIAANRLERLWERTARLGDRLAGLDEGTQHAFRKDLKKIRYTLELGPPLEDGKTWFKALKSLQESLGLLNDLAVLERFAPSLPAEDREAVDRARQTMLRDSRHRADLALGRTVRAWRQLRALPLPWEAVSGPRARRARSR